MADSNRPESPTPVASRPGVRPFSRPASGPRPALTRPTITPSRLTRPPFRAIGARPVTPPAEHAAPASPAPATRSEPVVREPVASSPIVHDPVIGAPVANEPVVATPHAVLSHVALGESTTRESDPAEMTLLGDRARDGLALTSTGASDVFMAEAHGQRESATPEPRATDATDGSATPSLAEALAEADPFVAVSRAPLLESDWWSSESDRPVSASPAAGDGTATHDVEMIGGTPHVRRVASALEVLANRVRSGEIPVESVPCDAGDAAFLAGLLTSLLLTRSSA